MDVKVLRRIRNGLGANLYSQIVTVIVQLVGVPILLYAWGAQLYGEWLILSAIPAYLSMSDLGFSQSAGNDMTARVARNDRDGALAVFQSLGALVFGVAIIGLILISTLLPSLPLDWLKFEAMTSSEARWVLWLLAADMFFRLPDGITHAGFRANGGYAFHMSFYSTTRLMQFAGVWIVALAGGGPIAAAAALLGIRALTMPTGVIVLARRHRWLHFGFAHAQAGELRRLFKPALANTAIPLAEGLNIQGMVLVVGAVLGPLAVVVFSTLRTLTRLALQLVLAVSNATEPELATAYGAGDRVLMRSLFIHALRAGFWIALAAAVGLALLGTSILAVWTHGKVSMNPVLFAWLLASATASVLWHGGLTVLKAANHHLRAAWLYTASSAVVVVLAWVLLRTTGELANAGSALLVMDAAMALYTLYAASLLMGSHPVAALAQAANPLPLLRSARETARFR